MHTSFDFSIVTLSILIAVYVSYIVVGICIRIAASQPITALYWTIGGALSMGTGIWAMHFVGMLAFSLPVPVNYDIVLTALSILPAVFASALALYMIRAQRKKLNLAVTAVLMGIGISAMHYIGMAAMGMGVCIEYSTGIVALSVIIAIVASHVALLLIFHQIDSNRMDHRFKLLSALIMGAAITSMHYIGMYAATFSADCVSNPIFGISVERDLLIVIVTLASLGILTLTQMMTNLDKTISEKSFFEAVFTAQSLVGKGLLVFENQKILLINDTLKRLLTINDDEALKIEHLSQSFEPDEFVQFKNWLKNTNHKQDMVNIQEFSLTTKCGGRILSASLVEFIHIDRVRRLIVTDDITQMKESELALNQLNESLEHRVEERTNELTQANEQLHESMASLKEAQSELVQSQKMASLGSLVAGISHEINTPIGVGVTSASSISEEVASFDEKYRSGGVKKSDLDSFIRHMKEASEILIMNLNRASELISSFKQVAVDQTDDNQRNIALHEYVDEIITSMRPKLKKTQIAVINELDNSLVINTKPGALYQIVNNLIMNSLIHAFDEGESGSITLSTETADNNLKIIYQDSGKGIEQDIITRIFDPFFTTRLGEGGSGLGLNIVYNIVTSTLKGKIDVSSSLGKGTRFEIQIPINLNEVNHV